MEVSEMRRTNRASGAHAGFTFVELLIATIIIGLLAALLIPAVLGQREKAMGASAESLLRSGAGTVEAAAVDAEGYAAITTAQLAEIEPNVSWRDAPGATATAGEVSVTDLGPNGYTLTTTAASGAVYLLTKDVTGAPTVTRTCGPGCTW